MKNYSTINLDKTPINEIGLYTSQLSDDITQLLLFGIDGDLEKLERVLVMHLIC